MTMHFTHIPELNQKLILPRIGKIRLGVKVKKENGTEYPKETPYFVVPPDVERIYGSQPTVLNIEIPVNELHTFMPTAYKWYDNQQQKVCEGNGQTARRYNPKSATKWETRSCPCEQFDAGTCTRRANIQVMLPDVNQGGVYQIDTSNLDAIVNLQSMCQFLQMEFGRFARIPLTLHRIPVKKRAPSGTMSTHYPLQLQAAIPPDQAEHIRKSTPDVLNQIANWRIPEPEDLNPAFDIGGTTVRESDFTPEPPMDPPPPVSPVNGHAAHPDDQFSSASVQEPMPEDLPAASPPPSAIQPITSNQFQYIKKLVGSHCSPQTLEERLETCTRSDASTLITQLQKKDFSFFTNPSPLSPIHP